MTLYDLKVEHLKEPVGLSVDIPRFSWKLASKERGTLQTAYRIRVFCGEKWIWDSGKVGSDQSVLVPYGGEEIEEEKRFLVEITVEDNHGNSAKSETFFETGLFDATGLQAQMITHDFPDEETACPVFYRTFTASKPVEKACLYATCHGVYEAYLNGIRVGDAYMAPGWTSYHKRLQYQYYDVTAQLQKENTLEMPVGNGWYKGILSYDVKPNRYGDRVEVLAEIHILYQDGSREVIATDESWQVKTSGIRFSEFYIGETIDTNAPQIRIGKVSAVPFDKTVLTPQESEPIRVTQRIAPVRVLTDPKGNHLVDFGQNLTGLVEVKIKGDKGQKITLRHAETLDKDGVFYPDTLRTAISHDTYILNGEEQTLMPHFTFHGFRYVALDGFEEIHPDMFTACAMHSDMEQIGYFHCDNEKVNQLQSNISWALRDNFFDIPTDCPQRDERLGWLGDAQVFSWTAAFNRNTALFFTKWMRDIAAESSLEEGVPHVVPDIQGSKSSAAWSDAAVIIPWVVYQTYGDKRILEESWQCMHEWVDYIHARVNENGLWMSGYQFGDWLALDREEGYYSVGATDVYLVANVYYLYVLDLIAKTARVLGKQEEAARYQNIYDQTLPSFRKEYFTARGRIVSETQTGCVLSLHFGLTDEEDKDTILKTLIKNIENHKNHLTTGFVGTPYLCHALSDNGAHDMAAALFMKEDYPSWLYAVNMGATTIWEKWNAIMPDGTMPDPGLNSLNHYANGAIGDWMYRKIGGINQLEAGYKRFYVKPLFVCGIQEAETELETPYGKIISYWHCKNQQIQVKVCVPANTTALIYLPEKENPIEVGSGEHVYEYATETNLAFLRFSLDNTLGEIIAQPLGLTLLNQYVPQLMANDAIEYVRRMTLTEFTSAAPDIRPAFEAVVNALNQQEGALQ